MLAAILSLLVSGFIVGGLARFALPGPDPMPIWMTIGIGIGGSLLGGGAAAALGADSSDVGTLFFASLAAAALILFLYRRLVQKRPLTGPQAKRPPLRPRGVGQIMRREPHQYLEETATPGQQPLEQLEKLVALRDAGKIDRDEFERRKAALVEQL